MRIKIVGDGGIARGLAGMLRKADFFVSDVAPFYTIYISEEESSPNSVGPNHIVVDGVDSELEREIINKIAALTEKPVLLQRAGGIQSDREIHITASTQDSEAVEKGILRALMKCSKQDGVMPTHKEIASMVQTLEGSLPRTKMWKKVLYILLVLALMLLAGLFSPIHAQQTSQTGIAPAASNIKQIGGTNQSSANVVDPANQAWRVNCILGCAAAASFTDNSAFTAGTSTVTNIGAVFNDGLGAVTSGNAAAPRMTNFRALHVHLRDASGNEIISLASAPAGTERGLVVRNIPSGTQTVSGTVAATQSGTWTVQPGNTANTTAWKVDGSAVTQPISGTVTANAGTNLNTSALALDATLGRAQASTTSGQTGPLVQGAVTTSAPTYTTAQTNPLSLNTAGGLRVDGSGVTQPVSGTFFQATQPVSVASLPLPSGASTSAKQPALGTAGSASADVITVQGIASMTKLLVTPDSVALPANQSVNAAQIAGTNTVTGGVAGLLAVGGNVANAGTATANPVPVGGIFTTTPATLTTGQTATMQFTAAQNLKHDLTTWGATALGTPTNFGTTPGAVVAGSVNASLFLGTVASATSASGVQKVGVVGNAGGIFDTTQNAAVPANAISMGCNFTTAPATVSTGNQGAAQCNSKGELLTQITDGTTNVGVIAGTTALKTDMSSVAGTATGTAAAGVQKVGIVGNANGAIDAANNAAAPANVIVDGFETATQTTTQPAAATAGNVRRGVARTDGVLYTALGGPVMWTCDLTGIGTTLTQCQAAPGAGLRLYITDILAVSTTTTSGLFTLRFGTGSNCGTGTGNLFFTSASATMPNIPNNATQGVASMTFITPLPVTANNAVCVLGVVTNTTNIQIKGYTAP